MPLLLFISFAHSHSLPPLISRSLFLYLSLPPTQASLPPLTHLCKVITTHMSFLARISKGTILLRQLFFLRKKGTREKHRSRTFLVSAFFFFDMSCREMRFILRLLFFSGGGRYLRIEFIIDVRRMHHFSFETS